MTPLRYLRNRPIRQQLMAMLLLTSGVVLALTCAALLSYEFLTFRQATAKNLSTLGAILAANSTASLAFNNVADATEVLSALKAEPQVVAAALYDRKGSVFARYPTGLPASALPATPAADGYRFDRAHLAGFEPVREGAGTRLGTLYLQSDLSAVSERLRLYGAIAALVMGVTLVVAYFLSTGLQGAISRPILALAQTAGAIADRKDYSVRASKLGGGELGLLTDAFNQMLGQIEDQDRTVRESKERLDLSLRASGVGTWSWNVGGNTLAWDDYTHPLFGLASGMFSGRFADFLSLVHPDDRERVTREMGEAVKEDLPYDTEYRVVWRDGTERVLAARGKPYRNTAGLPQRLTGVCWDITERRRLREELQRYATELERRVADRTRELEERNEALRRNAADLQAANTELDAFAYSVSHDLRAPLRSIDGFSQVLLEDYTERLDEAGRESLQRVRAASQRMATLIDDLLKLARVTRAEMRSEVVDLSGMARDIVNELQRTAPARQVEFAIAPGLQARGDPRLLRVALDNLLRNSWKYTAKQPRPRIEFGSIERNGGRAFMVRDNGAGFDMKYMDKLFGVFHRLHSTAEFEGTGVGLATVRRIITRHGGRIWAEGAVDRGATFYFTL